MRYQSAMYAIMAGIWLSNVGAATWSVQGEREPNSVYDNPSVLPVNPPPPTGEYVYFNGLVLHAFTGMNPNLGLLGGNQIISGQQSLVAYLGFWRDCNSDGYVGSAETVALEYRAELLMDPSLCPPQSPVNSAGFYPYNDGAWVREFHWIGWAQNAANTQSIEPSVVDDTQARVWADDGLPWTASTVGCPVNPPHGTFSTTGGLLAWVDCAGARGVFESINEIHGTIPPEFRFLDTDFENDGTRACSTSDLNQPLDLFYRNAACPTDHPGMLEPATGRPAFTVWDCENRATLTDLDGRTVVSQPLPNVNNLQSEMAERGSLYDGASGVVGGVDGQCSSTGGSRLDGTYASLIPEQNVVTASAKRETTFAFEFFNDRSGSYFGRVDDEPGSPPNAGLTAIDSVGVLGVAGGSRMGSGWQSQVTRGEATPLFRDDLTPEGPIYYTFYAKVGVTTTSMGGMLPGPIQGQKYGAAWCGSYNQGIYVGTDCDVQHWWSPEHGASEMPISTWTREPIGIRLLETYHLRDIDCHDGTPVSGLGVQGSLVVLSAEGGCIGFGQ